MVFLYCRISLLADFFVGGFLCWRISLLADFFVGGALFPLAVVQGKTGCLPSQLNRSV
jgi:hypothetical protein